ncbi:hypothetical protein E2542_SST24256 [Spatholobus suberectus]|nr:hypothetical protein E2542_SST24256 [Spatholobus suberectus]
MNPGLYTEPDAQIGGLVPYSTANPRTPPNSCRRPPRPRTINNRLATLAPPPLRGCRPLSREPSPNPTATPVRASTSPAVDCPATVTLQPSSRVSPTAIMFRMSFSSPPFLCKLERELKVTLGWSSHLVRRIGSCWAWPVRLLKRVSGLHFF